jgi:hypothetical protein
VTRRPNQLLTQISCSAAAANESGAYLMTAYRLHNEPGTVELLIRSGEIGDPRIFSAVFSFVASPTITASKAAIGAIPCRTLASIA